MLLAVRQKGMLEEYAESLGYGKNERETEAKVLGNGEIPSLCIRPKGKAFI